MIPLQLQTRIGALCVCVSEAIGHPSLSASSFLLLLQTNPPVSSFFLRVLAARHFWLADHQSNLVISIPPGRKAQRKKEEEEMAVRGRRVAPTTGASLVV